SSLAGLLLAATPSFGAILAWATGGHDRLDRRRIIGLAIGFVGVGALVGLDIRTNDVGAIGEALLVALGYAIGATIISRKLSTLRGAAPPTSVPVTEERTPLVRSSHSRAYSIHVPSTALFSSVSFFSGDRGCRPRRPSNGSSECRRRSPRTPMSRSGVGSKTS